VAKGRRLMLFRMTYNMLKDQRLRGQTFWAADRTEAIEYLHKWQEGLGKDFVVLSLRRLGASKFTAGGNLRKERKV
jgi:hypothetical protein